MQVLMVSPEPPYPLHGGGAYRTASLLHYFARFAEIDLILFSEGGRPADLPSGLVRSQQVIPLPVHSKSLPARYIRNARRAFAGSPPLMDRFARSGRQMGEAIAGRRYDVGILEHFWCAPFIAQLAPVCTRTILDLHNIESVLHERCAAVSRNLIRAGHRRFATASRRLEAALLPAFSLALAASESDAQTLSRIAPGTNLAIYPNSLPWVEVPDQPECPRLVFSGNFEYHPNIDAVRFLLSEIWPEVRRTTGALYPDLRLRLVGRGADAIRRLIPSGVRSGVEVSGAVSDAFSEIAQACIVIAPLRAGSGTRLKIIEAWAAGRPVIATPLGAEGLRVRDGDNIILASGAGSFASAIGALLGDARTRRDLGQSGRRTFENHYCWNSAWSALDVAINAQLTQKPGLNRYTGTSDAFRR